MKQFLIYRIIKAPTLDTDGLPVGQAAGPVNPIAGALAYRQGGQPLPGGRLVHEYVLAGTYEGEDEAGALTALAEDDARVLTQLDRAAWWKRCNETGDFSQPMPEPRKPVGMALEHHRVEENIRPLHELSAEAQKARDLAARARAEADEYDKHAAKFDHHAATQHPKAKE